MTQRFSSIVPLLLITLFCVGIVEGGYSGLEYFLLRSFKDDRKIPEKTSTVHSEKGVTEKSKQPLNYDIILKRNLFGEPAGKNRTIEKSAAILEELEATRLNIVLKGTIHGAKEQETRAVILDGSTAKQNLYQQGDFVQGAMIRKIMRGKVVLSHNGKDEILEMSETAGSPEPVAPVAVEPAKRSAPLRRPVLVGRMVGSKKVRPRPPAEVQKADTEEQPIE
ncbi:type II secretion system protein N [Desulfomarina sp.]